MKSRMMASVLGLVCILDFSPAQAAEWTWKRGVTVGGPVIAGAALGGPIGMVIGVAVGDYLGHQVGKAGQVDTLESELTIARQEADQLQIALHNARIYRNQYETLALNALQQDILFRTADDAPSQKAAKRLQALAAYLTENPAINVRLDGFADPRGADHYNLALSERRVEAVRRFLQEAGVNESRIAVNAYGGRLSTAEKGDADAYVLERAVTIALTDIDHEMAATD